MESVATAIDRRCNDFKELNDILFNDVCWHINNTDHSQISYRSTIRAIGAWTDGMIASLMGRLTEIKLVKDAMTVSDDELAHLLDQHNVPLSTGQKRKRFKLDELVKATLKSFAKACRVEFDLSAHSGKWQLFRDSIEIRNRVTHPKSPLDLKISDAEMKLVADSATWLQETIAFIAENRKTKRRRA